MATVVPESESLLVIYDGPDLANHSMEVSDLAPALMGIAEACQRANRLLNGEEPALSVRIVAELPPGCFSVILQVAQHAWDAATSLMPIVGEVTAAKSILDLLFGEKFSAVWLLKLLHGKDPRTVPQKPVEGGGIQLGPLDIRGDNNTVNNTVIVVPKDVLDAVSDPQFRKAIKRSTNPLRKRGVDTLEIGGGGNRQIISKADLPAFSELEPLDETVEDEREAIVEIVALDFYDKSKWRFNDGTVDFPATIDDPTFWEMIEGRTYRPAKGDELRVLMTITQRMRPKKTTEYKIVEVINIIEPRQGELGL